jgi:Leucine-rich repeat (LRR) protein
MDLVFRQELETQINNSHQMSLYGAIGNPEYNHMIDEIFRILPDYENNLQIIYMHHTNVDHIPEEIGELYQIHNLTLTYNQFTDLPMTLSNLHNLVHLDLSSNKKLKSIPKVVYKLTNLEELYLAWCNIESVDEEISNLVNLRVLIIGENPIKKLPDTIGNLKKLEKLNIVGCGLTKLPYSIGDLENLNKLLINYDQQYREDCIKNNKIKHLPESIRYLNKLEKIYCDISIIENVPFDILEKSCKTQIWDTINEKPNRAKKLVKWFQINQPFIKRASSVH